MNDQLANAAVAQRNCGQSALSTQPGTARDWKLFPAISFPQGFPSSKRTASYDDCRDLRGDSLGGGVF